MYVARFAARLLVTAYCLTLNAVQAADLILYDEDAATQWCQLERAEQVAEAAYEGEAGIRVEPTKWHQPFLRLPQRTDFRPYDLLEFYLRSPNGPIEQSIVVKDYATGAQVDLTLFIEGGLIDEQWR